MENPSSQSSGDPGQLVKETVSQGSQQASQAVSQVTDQAKQQAQSMLSRQKGQMTDTLSSVSSALSQTGDTLRQQNQTAIAGLADQAAGKIEGLSSYLETRDLNELVGEVENFARRNTGLFLGGALALGIVAARFLKSSAPTSAASGANGGGYYGGRQSYGSGGSYGYNSPGAYGQGTYGAEPTYPSQVTGSSYPAYQTPSPESSSYDTFGEESNSATSVSTFDSLGGEPAGDDLTTSTGTYPGTRSSVRNAELNDGPAR